MSVTLSASFQFSYGTITDFIPQFFASVTIGRIPLHGRILPFNDNSPIIAYDSSFYMIRIIKHSLINTTRLTHSLDDFICNLPFPRLTPSDFCGGTS